MSDEKKYTCPACGAPAPQIYKKEKYTCVYCGSHFTRHFIEQNLRLEWTGINVPSVNEPLITAEEPDKKIYNSAIDSKLTDSLAFSNKEQMVNPSYTVPPNKEKSKNKWIILLGIIFSVFLFCCILMSFKFAGKDKEASQINNKIPDKSETPIETTLTSTPPVLSETPTTTLTSTITSTALPSGIVNAAVGNFVNVRSGPGLNYIVAFLIEGQSSLSILHRNEQGDWYFIVTESGDRGWIHNALVQGTFEPLSLSISTEVIPTLTPVPTNTTTPIPTAPYSMQPPQGTWCASNNTRGFCVSGFEYKSYVGYKSANAESRFIAFGIGVKNMSEFDISVNPYDFTLVMEDGRTYEHVFETYYYNNSLQSVTVSPGNMATGAIVFYVPNVVGPRKIICRAGFLESNIEIDLYNPPDK